ncbi:response regulator [Telluribacter humicola]|uniref:response regulator n=1 Tax=Telluribacter humicola TaxID=1720261 RepID=UPI001A97AC10|nr:response regulator [Telluribacter humicola]
MKNGLCLLIDDDEEDHEIFTIAMIQTNPHIDCVAVTSGAAAVEKLRNDPDFIPDIIFLDMDMPGLNGKQTLVELRKIDRLDHVPIIILSTFEDEGFVAETKKLGSIGYVVKPTSIRELTKTLTWVLESPFLKENHFFCPRNPFSLF